MARFFEKISFNQFCTDCSCDKALYENYQLPKRSTQHSAGCDFYSLNNITLKPGESKKIPTGVKANMNDDEVLFLFVRSSMGFKYNIRMCNQVGIIDKDYYGNPDNDGHIMFAFYNIKEEDIEIKKGEAIGQALFQKYLITDDDKAEGKRMGGFGSTRK